jgi:hypothetical protein
MFFLCEKWGTERSLEKETVDTILRRFGAPQGLPNGELPAAAKFFFCTVSRKLICESKKYKFGGFKHAFFVACTARRAEAGLTHRNAEPQRS